ncbi:Phosphatidylinositol-3-phosphatase SAC1 [Friedmanniomyces endolithicus]|uniref:Phosphatidylinositol-3-phosphatase SAC1 n=1 Tax=Friedmanniomyces endolithicus TaxID=329885 RepID=A0AAN6FYV8_9PEZI|nr:Phosphatidylinositol-3-phosphatase SAC1 [Friedmanniomyces endolithicus]KAK0299466.1 Phosphatidylinositol-3-phosphatase SAC1 [Friedmanniomyces endolithicus]KAK0326960.1 Phosphatidylinositol-3-phosphatase SAC1 [Friedmanniomyces endolithicus]KAK1019205.1 Phosphatidylinositol-3-phosphatase SAC1 [Friedmanniomyces endolithicus]
MDQAVDELLEQEEKKALEKQAAWRRPDSETPEPVLGPPEPRRARNLGRNAVRPRGRDAARPHGRDPYSDEREENNERRSRKSRDMAEDVEMKDAHSDSDHKSANGSARDRRRSRSPDPEPREDRSRGDRPRHDRRDPRHSVDRSDGDRYWRPSEHRGSRRRSDDDRSRYRERDDRRFYRGDDRRNEREGPRRSPPRSKRARTPEPTDDERDRRTVFVQQLAARLRTKELQAFFEQVGPVVEAQIVKDRVSGRSKGVGYVEFREEDSVQKAIQLTGQKLLDIPIIVAVTEAEKNRQARNPEGTATQSNGIPFHRLYVGNIHFSITEEDLKNVFEPFGELEFVQLQKEEQGRSKGYGFVQFVDPAQAKEALEKMNGFELAGRPIRVGLGNDKFTPESTHSLLQRFGSQAQAAANQQGSSFSGMGGRGAHAGGTGNFDKASGRDADKTGGASALDDTDVAGVNFSNYSRDALMRKLARTDDAEAKIAPKAAMQTKKLLPIDQPAPSRCVLLKNMYNQADENEPGWQKTLEEDVSTECEDKYGHVVHIGLSLDNNDGEIYIKFDRVEGGQNAIRGLNGRWFGGQMITAQFVVDAVYHMNFPKALNL